jgi:hypothetical protein
MVHSRGAEYRYRRGGVDAARREDLSRRCRVAQTSRCEWG